MSSNKVGHLITSTIITLQHFATHHHTSSNYTSLQLSTNHFLSFTFHYLLIWLNCSNVSEGSFYARCEREKRPRVVLLRVGCSFPPWLSVMHHHFSHDRPNLCHPFFSSTSLQNFSDTLDLLSEVFNFQYHTALCSKM